MSPVVTQPDLARGLGEEVSRYIEHLADRVERAAHTVPKARLYERPFSFGNSVGHLVLHLTGNLNHYVGALIAGTGYVRDRPREFTEADPPAPEALLSEFRDAVAMVTRTIRAFGPDDWMTTVAGQSPIQTRFGLILVCTAHLNNHIGQMSYLVQALGHSTSEPPVW